MLGKKHTDEWKKRMSNRNSGKNNPFYGKKHTEETKRKISLLHKGRKFKKRRKRVFSSEWDRNYNFTTGYRSYRKEFQRHGGRPICSICGKKGRFAKNSIHVHHKDGNIHNNSMDNLQAVCSTCHAHVHKNWKDAVYARRKK